MLLDVMKERFVKLHKITESDGRGGEKESYISGVEFDAVVELSNSLEAAKAEKEGVTGLYDVTCSRSISLEWHTVFKRLSDGRIFRITSKDESETPKSTALDIRKARAEEWELPTDN